jgi:hypothetical protein
MRIFINVILLFVFASTVSAQYRKLPQSNTFRISQKKQVISIYPKRKKGGEDPRLVDIENNIVQTKLKNPNAIALIIAVGEYQNASIPKVKFAKRDASLMREYLIKRLGYDPNNIFPKSMDELPTAGFIKTYLKDRLKRILRPDGKSELFIYYVGHGAPSMINQNNAYLVPYDADPNYLTDLNAYAVNEFFADIAALPASKKMVLLDACFSGQTGDGNSIITNASPLTLKPKIDLFNDANSMILMSSKADQVSNWYPEKQHSLFTYFFLKGLQGIADLNSDGSITLSEMEQFLNDPNEGVPYIANRQFQRQQEVQVIGNKQMVIGLN